LRPTGVVLIAVYHFLAALMLALAGVSLFAGGTIFSALMGGANSGVFAGLGLLVGVVGGIFFLVFALVYAVAAWGVWTIREWGRILSIVMAVISLFFSLPGLFLMAMSMNLFSGRLPRAAPRDQWADYLVPDATAGQGGLSERLTGAIS
jgi:hypothetical protein